MSRVGLALGACALLVACGRLGFSADPLDSDAEVRVDDGALPPDSAVGAGDGGPSVGGSTEALGPSDGEPGGAVRRAVLPAEVGRTFVFELDGGGGGRGRHGTPGTADGGSGGRITFVFTPDVAGQFQIVLGGGGRAEIGGRTPDNPEPGAGGGGASSVTFDPDTVADTSDAFVLAVAGGGGGGGWSEVGADGGGGAGECGLDGDGGGGCGGLGGAAANGGGPGNDCPLGLNTGMPDPCGGEGGQGSSGGAGGFGVGAGSGSSAGNGSGGGGGGYGGGADGGYQGGNGAGGGAYVDVGRVTNVGGSTGGAGNAARYADGAALDGGAGRVRIEVR